jgi:biotin synthase
MVGSPYQTLEDLAEDLVYLQDLKPEMVGIGPFIPHSDTSLGSFKTGDMETVLFLISLTRLILPRALIPAATAAGTARKGGREAAVLHGANVLMTNITPRKVRELYNIYDGKRIAGDIAAEHETVRKRFEKMGYQFAIGRGDYENE